MNVSELKIRSNNFVSQLDVYIGAAVQENEVIILNLNRKQMKNHKKADDKVISPKYSGQYARRKGFSDPDLNLSGDHYEGLMLQVRGKKYDIGSGVAYSKYLISRYGEEIYGIAPSNQTEAQKVNAEVISKYYKKDVLGT